MIAIAMIVTFVVGIVSFISQVLHTGTSMFPFVFSALHVFSLLSTVILISEASREFDNDESFPRKFEPCGSFSYAVHQHYVSAHGLCAVR